ncbi:hypothetical protein OSTOST_20623 [Ostertagia ostertagi]
MMSSNDSLAGSRRDLGVDTMQQGSEIQDSPRGPPSVASSKREDVNYHHSQPHVVPQGGIPIQGQVLVDPATGQHYIVPQATFFPPAVQPMYFQAPPTPVYYPYGQVPTQGYVMQSAPPQAQYSVPLAAYQQRPYGFRPGYAQSTASSEDISRRDDDRRLEDPPPSSPSISLATQSGFFPTILFQQLQLHHFHFNTDMYFSIATFSQQQNPQRSSPNSQPEDPESGRDGFRRDVTRSSSEFQRLSGDFRRQGSGEFGRSTDSFSRVSNGDNARSEAYYRGSAADSEVFNRSSEAARMTERTPLYGGPPPWWGRHQDEHGDSLTDVESSRVFEVNEPPIETMFFTAPSRAAATAFTVNFDSADEEVSLQDAARKSAQARRILGRRSGGGSATSSGSQDSGLTRAEFPQGITRQQTYVLNKFVKVFLFLSPCLHSHLGQNTEENPEGADVEDRKECDVSSEAGTYVVGRLEAHASVGRLTYSTSKACSLASKVTHCKSSTLCQTEASTGERTDLAKEMSKLRTMAGIRAAASPAESRSAGNTARTSGVYDNSRPGPATPPQLPRPCTGRASLGAQPSNRSNLAASRVGSASTSNAPFRRGDGGRYSMRGNAPGVAPSSPQQNVRRPPFRAGTAPLRTPGANLAQQKEQEMNAWLRRKDYNPMKAAAEARKAKELKARSWRINILFKISEESSLCRIDRYLSMLDRLQANQLRESDSEKSHVTDLKSLWRSRRQKHASQRVIAEYSRGVVQDISRLSQQSSRASGKQLSGLARAVDMLSQKCKKSIELIRSQNKGCLSVSVEDLLAAAADPPRKGETLNEQLDRLSDAFDAVQRYLEQYSLDGHQSPIPDFTDDASEIQSVASSFTAHSSSLSARHRIS